MSSIPAPADLARVPGRPRTPIPRADDLGRSGEEGDAELARPAILIVDDVPANLVSLEAVLEPLGHRIVRASSGSEALKRMLVEEFAVVLLDVQMPGIDGFETASMVKSHPRLGATPIIFITAISRDSEHVFRGYDRGAVDYLLKPFEPTILRAKVRVFVDLFLRGERIKAQAALLRQREKELAERRMRERYQHAMEAMPVLLWTADSTGAVRYANAAWRQYAGHTGAQLVSFDDRRVVHPDDQPILAEAWLEVVRGLGTLDVECRLRRGIDGVYRWHLFRATLEREASEGWIVTATDVDASKRADELRTELLTREQEARQHAETANRSKDEFLATVSHELRTPLHAILGWVKMLRAGSLDPETAFVALETIERNATLQTGLVNDLLDVSRIAAGKFDVRMRTVVLGTVVRDATLDLRPAAAAKGIALELEMGEGTDREIAGDAGRLQQVVWNLVSNAVKFTPPGGRIFVRARIEAQWAELRVEDTGEGMPAAFLPFAFDRFTQADGGTTRKQGGLGLGLAIVRQVVELHGGSVGVERSDEGITVFWVRFPARSPRREQGEIDTPQPSPRPASRLGDVSVLVVDDDEDARALMAAALSGVGARVRTCGSAAEAIAAIAEAVPDVFISDVGLPNEDGCSLMERVREGEAVRGAMPAIAVSGYTRPGDRERALRAGFDLHFGKPLDLEKLMHTLVDLVERRRAPREPGES